MRLYAFIIFIVVGFLISCSHQSNKKNEGKVITVTKSRAVQPLYYAGTIRPLKSSIITAPTDGVIEKMYSHYGEFVKKGQVILSIQSEKFKTDYKSALMQYVKAKNEFNTNESQLKEGEFLHKNELISEDEFKLRQTNFYNAQLSLLQAKDALQVFLKQLNIEGKNLYQLSISDIDKITHAFQVDDHDTGIQVVANSSGFLLQPEKTETDKKIEVGKSIKQDDVLAIIGDSHGFTINININEFDVNKITPGQDVIVKGSAFDGMTLQGKIASIDHQAVPNQNGLPIFDAEVIVDHLSDEEMNHIHVGMSSKVEIPIHQNEKIAIPLKSVEDKNGVAYVKKWNLTAKRFDEVPVKTGQTTEDGIVVLANLKVGDKIFVAH